MTLWYIVVLSLVLLFFGAGLYVLASRARLAQLDAELARSCAAVAKLITQELDEEGSDLPTAARETQADFPLAGRTFAVYDEAGSLLAGGPAPADWRVHVERYAHRSGAFQVSAAESLAAVERERRVLGRTLTIAIPVALVLAGAGGWLIAGRALRPVGVMVAQTRRITDRTPGFRLTVANPHDELGRLAEAFNDLLGRLEGALQAQRQFMADASHELRTPVSIARTATDVTLSHDRPVEDYRDALTVVAHQTRRLAQMVEDMFTLARGDAGALKIDPTDFYFDELLSDCARDAMVLAKERGVEVRQNGAREVAFRGDESLLRRMILNLLHNAVRYTPAGGHVDVELKTADSTLALAVTDRGPGIPLAERDRIFERFVRLDAARGPDGGAGLGLAITRSIAEAHGGTVVLDRSGPSGSTFLVRLPL